MELGVLVEGGHLPETVDRYFDELIEAEQLQRVEDVLEIGQVPVDQ